MVIRIILLICLALTLPAMANGEPHGEPGPVDLSLHGALGPCTPLANLCDVHGGLVVGVRLFRWTDPAGHGMVLALDSRVDIAYSLRVLPGLRLGPAGWPVQPYLTFHAGPEIVSGGCESHCVRATPYGSAGVGLFAPASTLFGFRLEIAYVFSPPYTTCVDGTCALDTPLELVIGVTLRPRKKGALSRPMDER